MSIDKKIEELCLMADHYYLDGKFQKALKELVKLAQDIEHEVVELPTEHLTGVEVIDKSEVDELLKQAKNEALEETLEVIKEVMKEMNLLSSKGFVRTDILLKRTEEAINKLIKE